MIRVTDVEINGNTTPLLLMSNGVELLIENKYIKVFGNPDVKEDISSICSFDEVLWMITNILLRLNIIHGEYNDEEIFYIKNWLELNK